MTEQLTELQVKRLEFLDEMVSHFNASNRGRRIDSEKCSYENGCAIGRHLPKEVGKLLDGESFSSIVAIEKQPEKYEKYIPEKLKYLGVYFLGCAQALHDKKDGWNAKGLSEEGVKVYMQIRTAVLDSTVDKELYIAIK